MTITNSANFREWVKEKAKTGGQELADVFNLLNVRPDADEVVDLALTESWTGKEMAEYLNAGSEITVPMSPPTAVVPTASPAPRAGGKPTRAQALRERRGGPAPAIEAIPSDQPVIRKGGVRHQKAEQEPKPAKGNILTRIWSKKTDPAEARAKSAGGSKKKVVMIGVIALVVILIVGAVLYFMRFGGGSGYPIGGSNSPRGGSPTTVPTDPGQSYPSREAVPMAPPDNPLNFEGSVAAKGFLGIVQKLVFVTGLGILLALLGDVIYRKQVWDGVTTILAVSFSIHLLFPSGVPVWIGLVFFIRELYLVWFAAFQGGQDYSSLAAYFLLVGVFGGLVWTQIAAIQNIFPQMMVAIVPPIVSLGYYFQTMNLAAMAFPLVVYLFVLVGYIVSVIESVRPSGEDRSSRFGSLISASVGLAVYFLFLHLVHLTPWISFLIAFLVSAGGSAALRSEPAKQFVTPKFGVRSPFDGAMLFSATILILLVIFGQGMWLVGLF